MNLRRTLAISRRIANQFRRDERTLALMFVAPLVILGLLGWVIRDQGAPETRLAVVNEATGPGERIALEIERALTGEGIVVESPPADEAAAREALRNGELDVVIVLPEDLFRNQAGPPALRVITPGINPADDAGHIARLQAALLPALAGGTFPRARPPGRGSSGSPGGCRARGRAAPSARGSPPRPPGAPARPRSGRRSRARCSAIRRFSASATSRCWAPSWRSRSIRRRSASAAAMIRERASCSSVTCAVSSGSALEPSSCAASQPYRRPSAARAPGCRRTGPAPRAARAPSASASVSTWIAADSTPVRIAQ